MGALGELGAERFTLFGVGGLGAYAIAFAADHPDLVARLVLTNPQDGLVGHNSADFLVSSQRLAEADPDLGIASAVRRFLGPEPEREHFIGLVGAELAGLRLSRAVDAAMANVYDISDRLSQVQAATLIIRRPDYENMTPDSERRIAAGIEGARLVSIPGAGIFPWTGDVDAVVEVVRGFIDATPAN